MAVPKFATAYANQRKSRLVFRGETLTEQHHARECDMNHILKKYRQTGLLNHVNRYQGNYDDVSVAVDFHTALNIVQESQDMFMSLPASIRNQFDNDPGAFLDFVSDESNKEKMEDMGLIPKAVVSPAQAQPVTVEPQPAGGGSETTTTETTTTEGGV